MIIKYKQGDVWGFIDNVNQSAYKQTNSDELLKQYDDECQSGERVDVCNYGVCKDDINQSNKLFLMSSELVSEDVEDKNVRTINLIDEQNIDYPSGIVVIYLDNSKEFDCFVLISNQPIYLMNNEGKTIERLI